MEVTIKGDEHVLVPLGVRKNGGIRGSSEGHRGRPRQLGPGAPRGVIKPCAGLNKLPAYLTEMRKRTDSGIVWGAVSDRVEHLRAVPGSGLVVVREKKVLQPRSPSHIVRDDVIRDTTGKILENYAARGNVASHV